MIKLANLLEFSQEQNPKNTEEKKASLHVYIDTIGVKLFKERLIISLCKTSQPIIRCHQVLDPHGLLDLSFETHSQINQRQTTGLADIKHRHFT